MSNNPVKTPVKKQTPFIQSMLDASINGILLLKPVYGGCDEIEDFVVTAANRAITAHVGIELHDAVNAKVSHLFPHYKEAGFFDVYVTAFTTRELQRKELLYTNEPFEGWYEVSVAPTEEMLVVSFANITEHKLQKQEIDMSASRLDAIINTSQSGIFLFKPVLGATGEVIDFIFTKANPALASYVGQKQEALIGAFGSRWFPAYKTNGLFDLYRETYLTGKTNRFDFHYNADNIDVWLDIMSTKLGDEVLVTFTDYTPIKKLQLELEETVNELQRSNANLEEFAYVASHDLQEPLRKIQYFATKLKTIYEGQTGAEPLLNRMEDATSRMRILIDDLLAYSRFSFKSNTDVTVDLEEVVLEVLEDLEAIISEKNASIKITNLPRVAGDKAQLRQLFQNLLGNALKYNRADVPLEITLQSTITDGAALEDTLPINDQQKRFYLVEVRDNGVGFEQTYSRHIFKIFQRLHGRAEYPGTGVGLAIVQKVAENHKGYVYAEGTPGVGATFKVLFPLPELDRT